VAKDGESSLNAGGLIEIYAHPPSQLQANPPSVAKNSPLFKSGWRMVNTDDLVLSDEAIDFTK
jgi:hypothetical protein